MDNSASHRIQHRLAIVDSEVPNFQGIKNGVYLTDISGKAGYVSYFDQQALKVKCGGKPILSLKNISVDDQRGVIIGSKPVYTQSPGTVIVGEDSGEALVVGSDNILIGRNVAGSMMEGNNNIGIGQNSLKDSSAIGDIIAIGGGAMGMCGKTEMNIGIGKDALSRIHDSYNIAVGVEAGKEMVGPLINHNIAIGRGAMRNTSASAIHVTAIGSQVCEEMSGNNFQSVYIGDKVAQNLSSRVISINNVGIGSEVLAEAHDVSDSVCLGAAAGRTITGVKVVAVGPNVANQTEGTLTEEVLIGYQAGSNRSYLESKNVLIGSEAGRKGTGVGLIGVGTLAGSESEGNMNLCIGSSAGKYLVGSENLALGSGAGHSSTGSMNIFLGSKAGQGVFGDSNIWIGSMEPMGDLLSESVVVGHDAFAKGEKAVVIGQGAGKSSTGVLNGDLLIGHSAGAGQNYLEDGFDEKGLILIGSCAGKGNVSHPDQVNSSDLVCLGHSAGASEDQNFVKTVMVGNYAGSFATSVEESVVIGHSAGVGMNGKRNLCLGAGAGVNLKGSGNILLGSGVGDRTGMTGTLDDTLMLGSRITGNLKHGNLFLGGQGVVDGEGVLGLVNGPRVKQASVPVLYSTENQLEYQAGGRVTLLTFPVKVVIRGNLNGAGVRLNPSVEGSSLLTIKIVPMTKLNYLLSTQILLCAQKGVINLGSLNSDKWKTEVVGETLLFKTDTLVEGILYLEVVGDHVIGKA